MNDPESESLAIALTHLGGALDKVLRAEVGVDVPFVLICQINHVAQYISNADRGDGMALIRSLLERWETGRADIPAHYNPDL
jgi:hypothetical protein